MTAFTSKWIPLENGRAISDKSPSGTNGTPEVTSVEPKNSPAHTQGMPLENITLHNESTVKEVFRANTGSNGSAISAGSPEPFLDPAWFDPIRPVPVPVHELTDDQVRALARCGKRYHVEPTPAHLLPPPLPGELDGAA